MHRSHSIRLVTLLLLVAAAVAALNGGWSWDDIVAFVALV